MKRYTVTAGLIVAKIKTDILLYMYLNRKRRKILVSTATDDNYYRRISQIIGEKTPVTLLP